MTKNASIANLLGLVGLIWVWASGGFAFGADELIYHRASQISAAYEFRDGQLVNYEEPTPALERLPPVLPEEEEVSTSPNCFPPLPRPSWPSGTAIKSAAAQIPLPEGLVPQITGSTSEEHRHNGIGQPLDEGVSWLTCSHSAGTFAGGIGGTTLIDNQLEEGVGGAFGLRFGIDYDHRWGLEKRFGFAQMNVTDRIHHQKQTIDLELGDIDLLFYPWGDSRWRPYLSAGAGIAHFNYQSESNRRIDRLLIGLPFGMGLKYLWGQAVDIRIEVVDNLMLGTHEVSTMNNLSLTAGVEFRYHGFNLMKRLGG